MNDRPMTLAEVAAESRSRMSDPQKVELLRDVLRSAYATVEVAAGEAAFYGAHKQAKERTALAEKMRNALRDTATQDN